MLGVIEEWDLLGLFTKSGVFFVSSAASPLPSMQLRPLNIAPHAIAYVLGPNSFLSWHLLLAASLVLKVVAMSFVVWWVQGSRWLALCGGLLFLLYPADTMQMTLRAVHINWAVVATLGGIALVLAATDARGAVARVSFALLGAVSFVLGSLTYEAGLFLAPAPVLLWWAKYGLGPGVRALRHQLVPLLAWIGAVFLAVGYIVLISRQGGLYQDSVGVSPHSLVALLASRLPLLFTIGMYREFAHGWYDAARIFAESPRVWPYLGLLGLVMAGLAVALRHDWNAGEGNEWRMAVKLVVAGFLLACLGFAPYLSTPSHVIITQRTHLYSAVGGTIATTAILSLIAGRQVIARICLWAVLLGLGLCAQWNQLAHYTDLSLRERMLLSGILQAAPDVPPGGHFLIIDQSGQLQSTWMMRGTILGNALTYLYGHGVTPEVCVMPGLIWSSFAMDAAGRPGKCVEQATSWDIGAGVPGAFSWSKQDLIQLVITPDGTVARSGGETPPAVSAAQAKRWAGILGCWPATPCHYTPPLQASYFYDFGRRWSLEEAPWGAGWQDAVWAPPALQPVSFAWMNAPHSTLWVPLTPTGGRYRFRMRAYTWISQDAKNSLSVTINNQVLTLAWSSPDIVEAAVPAGMLKSGLNELLFSATVDPTYGISGAVDWISVAPE